MADKPDAPIDLLAAMQAMKERILDEPNTPPIYIGSRAFLRHVFPPPRPTTEPDQ